MKLVITLRAIRQAEAIASAMTSSSAGLRFIKEARATYERIATMPTIGSEIDVFRGTVYDGRRQCTVRGFRNYVVIYGYMAETVTIHQVFDGRRNYNDLFANLQ